MNKMIDCVKDLDRYEKVKVIESDTTCARKAMCWITLIFGIFRRKNKTIA